MINFACVYYGDKYKVEYVQKLYNMVKRHLTIDHKFYVFTDHVKLQKLVEGDIIVKKFPEDDLDGWWNKMQLFHPDTPLEGTTLYTDLDVVITGNINCFVEYEPNADFVGMNDFNPATKGWNSSVMKFKDVSEILWKPFVADRPNLLRRYPGDQNLISAQIKDKAGAPSSIKSFPDSWTQSYKWLNRKGERYHTTKMTYEQDPNAKVCVFHGSPNPAESTQEWVKELWK